MGVADQLAPYCDSFFSQAAALNGAEGWTAAVMYSFQIYCDFSGYSDMAVGIGYLFGLELARNFDSPYVSGSATEFWRRWHMTLSAWIRDYIYIALGGSRKGRVRQYANLFAAMVISGFWHGSEWTFVAWGMYQGALLVAHKGYGQLLDTAGFSRVRTFGWYRLLAVLFFYMLTCLGWVLFRTQGLRTACGLIGRMLRPEAVLMPRWVWPFWGVAALLYALHLAEWQLLRNLHRVSAIWHRWFPSPLRAAFYCMFILIIVLLLRHEQSSFIYFQF
jgi:alginate O-acetyltransferase complex protein AlgI